MIGADYPSHSGDTRPGVGNGRARGVPTRMQRAVLEHLAHGDRLAYLEGETSLCLVSSDGDFHGRVYGGMRQRLVSAGWVSRNLLTGAGRAVLSPASPIAAGSSPEEGL